MIITASQDSEWTTNEEAVDGGGDDVVCATQIKCDLKTEQQQQPSTTPSPPRPSTAEPEESPPATAITTTAAIVISPKLRVNPNLATDPAKWPSSSSSSSSLSAEVPSSQSPPPTTTASITNTTHSVTSSLSSSSSLLVQSISAVPETNVVTITAPRGTYHYISEYLHTRSCHLISYMSSISHLLLFVPSKSLFIK